MRPLLPPLYNTPRFIDTNRTFRGILQPMNKLIEELKSQVQAIDTDYRIGMRVVKTALAVALCLFVAWLLGSDDLMAIAAISALITLRSTHQDTLHTGVSRVLGSAIGGVFGLLAVIIGIFLPHYADGLFVIVIPVLLVLNLYACNLLKMKDSCAISCVIMIVVASQTEQDLSVAETLIFTLIRLRDTFIGVAIASVLDLIPFRKKEKTPPDGDV